jgi:(2Fe-2S) ferredoxin
MTPKITVCRGCCCGTARKHPDVDHAYQLQVLRSRLPAVLVADCLDACEVSNVVVVRPTPAARAAGARPVWVGSVLDEDAVDGVVEWVEAGGPGVAAAPPSVAARIVPAPAVKDKRGR